MKITKGKNFTIEVTNPGEDGGHIWTQSVEANILFAILEQLKEINKVLTENRFLP